MAGTGLGLAIVKQAAIRLRATVQLGPGRDGAGCAFRVAIPHGPLQPPA